MLDHCSRFHPVEFHHSWKLKMRQRSAQHLIPLVDAEEEDMLVKAVGLDVPDRAAGD